MSASRGVRPNAHWTAKLSFNNTASTRYKMATRILSARRVSCGRKGYTLASGSPAPSYTAISAVQDARARRNDPGHRWRFKPSCQLDFAPRGHLCSRHACRSSSSSRQCARAIPVWFEYRSRLPASGSQRVSESVARRALRHAAVPACVRYSALQDGFVQMMAP